MLLGSLLSQIGCIPLLMVASLLAMISLIDIYFGMITKLPLFAKIAVSSSVRTRSVRLITNLDL